MTNDLKLGLQLGYWTAQPPAGRDLIELAQQVEALGFDSIWTGESWSSDAYEGKRRARTAEARHQSDCSRPSLRAHAHQGTELTH